MRSVYLCSQCLGGEGKTSWHPARAMWWDFSLTRQPTNNDDSKTQISIRDGIWESCNKEKTRDRAINTKSYRSQKRPTMPRACVKMWVGLWMESPKARWCTHRGSCGGRVPVTAFGTMGFAFSYFLCLYIWAWAHTRQFLPCSSHAHWTWAWSRAVAPGLGQSTALFSLYHMPRASSNTVGFERICYPLGKLRERERDIFSLLFLQSQTSETHVAFCTVQPTLPRPRQHSLSHKAWF